MVLTGATSGIGWDTALELARAGAEGTIPARVQSKADDAAARIRAGVPTAKLRAAVMDLASLRFVREFAEKELTDPRPIDTLVNNGGVMAIPTRTLTADGFEIQFATVVLGHFRSTGALLADAAAANAPRDG